MTKKRFSKGQGGWVRGRPRWQSRWRLAADVALAAALLGMLGLVATRMDRVASQTLQGVPRVIDGDSLELAGSRLRLRGMDAPELRQTCRRDGEDYACGREARDALAGLVAAGVSCTGWERDRYRRLLVACEGRSGDVASELVRSGWAVAWGDFDGEEREAQRARSGLWAGDFERPRDWRAVHGDMVETEHDWLGRLANLLRGLMAGPSIREDNR